MPKFKHFVFIVFISLLGIAVGEECNDIKYTVSKCYEKQYQWLIEIPKNNASCDGKTVAQPKIVPCNFACPKGQTFDRSTLGCRNCPPGTFSLGGGKQYTFDEASGLKSLPSEFSLQTSPLVSSYNIECKRKEMWQIKGNILQGDVRPNCAIKLSFRFQLERAGSITIAYNLPTSYVFGTISSRCDFNIIENDNDDDDNSSSDDSDLKRRFIITLPPTGYGIWTEKNMKIPEPGDYVLSLFTVSVTAFHFPFSIRSIVVEGVSFLQECIPCPPGTYSSGEGSDTCKPCKINTYAASERSTKCETCEKSADYAEEGSSKCTQRPPCEMKHYQKVFVGCDKSNMATVKYEPIQPQICSGGTPPTEIKQAPCGTCNPGMYKEQESGSCQFCPAKTYSDGTLNECRPCENELSLLPGLYYKIWNELPPFLNRTYMSFDETKDLSRFTHSQSWVPSIDYISSQSLADTLSMLTLTIPKGFRETDLAKSMKEFGTLYFKFSIQCQMACSLFFVTQDLNNDGNDWDVIEKWTVKNKTEHTNIINYTYSIQSSDELIFNWLFTSDATDDDIDEIRIYEISVTNVKGGGSDRCVSCLTINNLETECRSCTPGYILSNNSCTPCPKSTIASRIRPNDPVPTVCKPCPNNTMSDDGISCYVPCKQSFNGSIEYDLNPISTIVFHGSKLFTQKGSGYFHVFNTSICGKTSVTCAKTQTFEETKRSKNQIKVDSKLCRMGTVPDADEKQATVAYIDDFGEELLNISLSGSKYFPPLRSDYNLSDITLVYRADSSTSQSTCSERVTFLTLRCDHLLDDEQQNSSIKYKLQTPNDCVTGTCDGCVFHFLLRTPFACPTCDENKNGYRVFSGPCKFGHQEIRKIPYPYCAHSLSEKTEIRSCSMLSMEIKIIIGLFLIIAATLVFIVIMCWRKNRKLEYRYMQLVENTNPDDDAPVDNVCAQISDEEDSGDEVQFKKESRTKKIMNAVRRAVGKSPKNGQSESFGGESFLLESSSTNEA